MWHRTMKLSRCFIRDVFRFYNTSLDSTGLLKYVIKKPASYQSCAGKKAYFDSELVNSDNICKTACQVIGDNTKSKKDNIDCNCFRW